MSAVVDAAVTSTTQHEEGGVAFDSLMSNTDLIAGKIAVEKPGDLGWHNANPAAIDSNNPNGLPAFTDGAGFVGNLTGLLNDNFPIEIASGRPVKIVEYSLDGPSNIDRINIFSGNRLDADGRIFSTAYIEYSTDGTTLLPLGYFQSDPSGTINNEMNPVAPLDPAQNLTMLSIFDDASPTMLTGVNKIVFSFYSVDNTQGQMRDPFDGVNAFTGIDDELTAAFNSPLIIEIDVLGSSAGIVGDYNGNGKVYAADYTVWRDTLNASVANGTGADGSGNGVIDQTDYDLWKANFGDGGPGVGASVVPEPSSLLVAIVPLITAGNLRGCRRIRRIP
jgi:hypothetical protein